MNLHWSGWMKMLTPVIMMKLAMSLKRTWFPKLLSVKPIAAHFIEPKRNIWRTSPKLKHHLPRPTLPASKHLLQCRWRMSKLNNHNSLRRVLSTLVYCRTIHIILENRCRILYLEMEDWQTELDDWTRRVFHLRMSYLLLRLNRQLQPLLL
jgi:hypothetical protein